jgi:anaerobic selenocysteine-containing dehydrogenase
MQIPCVPGVGPEEGIVSEWKKTVCVLCATNCGLEVRTDANRITKVRPDKDSPRSQGYVCRKGLAIGDFQDHPDRLKHPLKRAGHGFERISWEQATREIADKLRGIVDTHGPKAFAAMGGFGLGCHFGRPFFGGLLQGLGSPYHYHPLAQELTGQFYVSGEAYGSQGIGVSPDEEHTDVLVIWGSNTWRSHHMYRARPMLGELKKNPEKSLIVIDPCRTDTAKRADIHLALRPGTDALLLKSMLAILLEEGIHASEHVEQHATGFSEIERLLAGFDVSAALEVCRLDEAKVREVTRFLAASRCAIHSDLGILMSRNSTLNSYLLMLLVNLLGRVGEKGGNVFRGGLLPSSGHTPLEDPSNWRTVETGFPAIWGMYPPNVLPEEIMSAHPERLRALLVSQSNPLRSYADTRAHEEAFERLDLLVTADIAMTETARLSDYVLPARSAYEKWDGCFFSFSYPEYYFHLRRPVCEALGEPKEEAAIWTDLADALGLVPDYPAELEELAARDRLQYGMALMKWLGDNPASAGMLPYVVAKTLGKALDSPALALFWSMLIQFGATGGARLERAGYTPSPVLGEELFQKFLDAPGDILLAVQDTERNLAENIATDDGKVHLHIPRLDDWMEKINPREELEALEATDYPLVLAAGERTDYNATSRMRNRASARGKKSCAARLHPEDAAELGLETGVTAVVETEAGSLEVEVEVSDRPCRGMVIIPHGFGLQVGETVEGVNVNYLTAARHRDPLAGTPLHKSIPCRVKAR